MPHLPSRSIAPCIALLLLLDPALAPAQQSCTTRRMSTTALGLEAGGHSRSPALSPEGRWIAFESAAGDLVPGDTNGLSDVFLKSVLTGEITLLSRGLGGLPANGPSDHASISSDGLWVLFESEASNLVANDTNGVRDVFLHSRTSGDLVRVSVSSTGQQANGASGQGGLLKGSDISHDGGRIAFQSSATNLVQGDTNLASDIFVLDRPAQSLMRVTIHAGGQQANGGSQDPALSGDGTRVAFTTNATNLVTPDVNGVEDVLVVEVATLAKHRASQHSSGAQSDGPSYRPRLSQDGSIVAFESFATNLVPGDTNGVIDVFVHDTTTLLTERASLGAAGQQANQYAYRPALSADGARVAFTSAASNLIPGGNGIQSVYVRDRALGTTERWGQGSDGANGFAGSGDASIAAGGEQVAFTSLAALVPQDTNGAQDVYLRSCGPTGTVLCNGTAAACPCGNGGAVPGGCINSTGLPASLAGNGTTSVFADTLTLEIVGLPASAPVLFFQGTSATAPGTVLGDGLRCVGGSVRRLGTRLASPLGSCSFGSAVVGDPLISVRGAIPPEGGLRLYQGWYRDTAPFCTPDGFNLSNAFVIEWAP